MSGQNDIAYALAKELVDSDLFPEAVAKAMSALCAEVSITKLMAILEVKSESTIRNNKELMALSRYIDGIGRRWNINKVKEWVQEQPRHKTHPGVRITELN